MHLNIRGKYPLRWYAVARAQDIRSEPVGVVRFGVPIVLARTTAGLIAALDRCPHRGVKLSLGRVSGATLACGYHGFRFNTSGTCELMPCEGQGARPKSGMCLETYPVQQAHGLIWMFPGTADEASRRELPWLEELQTRPLASSETVLEWPMPFARSVESNFDIHHGPFLHKSILPGMGGFVSSLNIEDIEDGFSETVALGDESKPNKKPAVFTATWKMPGLVKIALGPFGGFAFDTPIDDDNTWRFFRFMWGPPLLGKFVCWLLVLLEVHLVQGRQDKPMVQSTWTLDGQPLSQDPDDRLVGADAGIARFRKQLRATLREEAKGNARSLPLAG